MKKSLLLFAVMASFIFASAQSYWTESTYPYLVAGTGADLYPEWTAVTPAADWTAIIDATDAWTVKGLTNLTDFTNAAHTVTNVEGESALWVNSKARYSLSGSADVLSVDFDATVAGSAYDNFAVMTFGWKHNGPNGAGASGKVNGDTVIGTLVDVLDGGDGYKVISGLINIPLSLVGASEKPFIIRASFFDAHGHEWNAGGDPFDTIVDAQIGDWTKFSIDYDELIGVATPGDGYSGDFHGVARPASMKGSDGEIRVPIDFTKIVGIRFYLLPGVISTVPTAKGTVKFKNIVIGDATEGVLMDFHRGEEPTLWVAPAVETAISELDVEGEVVSVEVLNTLGQTIQTGASLEDVNLEGISIVKMTLSTGEVVSKVIGVVK